MHPTGGTVRFHVLLLLCPILICLDAVDSRGEESAEAVRFTNTIKVLGSKNLLPNGSFETGHAGWSSLGHGVGYQNLWAPLVPNWGNLAVLHGTVERTGGAHGEAFLRIPLGGEDTPVANFDYFYPVSHRELRPLAANMGWIQVDPGEPYVISLSLRASREGTQAAFGVQNEDAGQGWNGAQDEILMKVNLGTHWQRFTNSFVPKYPFLFVLAGPDLAEEEQVAVDVDAVQLEKGSAATPFESRKSMEIGVVPSSPAGVFTSGEGAVKISAFNATDAPARADIAFQVTDFFDEAVDLAPVSLEVDPGSVAETLISLPAAWHGFYRVVAACKSGEVEESHVLRLAVVPPRTSTKSVLGVNHAYPNEFLIGLAKKAGVSWYRDWSLKWQHIEPEPGNYHWEISDPQINRISAQNVNLMAMIPFPSADWNSTAPSLETLKMLSPRYNAGGRGDDQELLPRARWAWPPREASELSRFVGSAVTRYQKQIQVWEFLNEPLFTSYVLPDENALGTDKIKAHTVEDYLNLLRIAYPAIHAANPEARVMGGPGTSVGTYTIQMLEAGVLDIVDIYGLHDYPRMAKPEERLTSNDALLAAMAKHGGIKPIWMTEFSYFGTDDLPRSPFIPIPGLWSENKLLSEREVADYTVRYFTIFLGRGGEKIFLHSGCTGSVNKPGTESCLFADGAVRKVFPAVAVFTEIMGPSPKHVADDTKGKGLIFAFEGGKQSILVLWDPENEATVTIPQGITCFDIMGRSIAQESISLNASPVYFVGKAGAANDLFSKSLATMH